MEWGRKDIEAEFGERNPISNIRLRLGADSHTQHLSHTRLLVLGVCLGSPFYFFLWTPSYFFPLNQSGFGNINTGIMTNLSMWERKDVSAVLVEHLGSSYSRERARGPH